MKLSTLGQLTLCSQSQTTAPEQCLATSNNCVDFTTAISLIFVKSLVLETE